MRLFFNKLDGILQGIGENVMMQLHLGTNLIYKLKFGKPGKIISAVFSVFPMYPNVKHGCGYK